MKKKGFTLIELLAVIAILAILVIIAVPTVLQLFQDAKRNTFRTQAQQIFKAAEQQYMSDSISGNLPADGKYCQDGAESELDTPLDLSGSQAVLYEITFTGDEMTSFTVKDNTYGITLATYTIDAISGATLVEGGDLTTLAIDCSD